VPDAVYLVSLDHAVTPEETVFRDVLVFHRDCLNGGLGQALYDLDEKPVAPVVEAYRAVGLSDIASLLNEAFVIWQREHDLDQLTDRYVRLTYGEDNEQPDAVEKAALRYAQEHEGAFASIAGAAERGDFKKFDFGGIG
jgi:hypothetical protein